VFGQPREKVFTVKLWLLFTLSLAAVVVRFAVSFYVLPYDLIWFTGALLLLIAGILLIAPTWLR